MIKSGKVLPEVLETRCIEFSGLDVAVTVIGNSDPAKEIAKLIAAAPETLAERDRMKAFLEHTYEGDGNIDFDELHLALYGSQPK